MPPEPPATDSAPSGPAPAAGASRVYEREIVFLSTGTDSTLAVPWLFSARDGGTEVERRVRGWLSRNGSWEAFLDEAWDGPATRAPWRLLPRGPVRLVVGPEDALERVVYERGARHLEIGFGGLLAEWTGTGARVFRIHEASAVLSSQSVEGVLLDVNRTRPSGPVHGEWAFLVSGDSLQMVLDGIRPGDVPLGGGSAWARLDFRQLQWADLRIEWTDVRAFERARRDVPVAWRLAAADGFVEGEIRARTSDVEAGTGSGPQLPVHALFEVEGEVRVEGTDIPVQGLLRHVQN